MEGGDWDRIKRRWGMRRYYAMHAHWAEFGPPVYLAVAAYLGMTKPKAQVIEDGDDLAAELGAWAPGGSG